MLYRARREEAALSEREFALLVGAALNRVGGRIVQWDPPRWVALACGAVAGWSGASSSHGSASNEYEVLVSFSQRTRVAHSSRRLHLQREEWTVSIEEVPRHGKARKEFLRDELERWGKMAERGRGCFGTGLEDVGVDQTVYEVAAEGGFRRYTSEGRVVLPAMRTLSASERPNASSLRPPSVCAGSPGGMRRRWSPAVVFAGSEVESLQSAMRAAERLVAGGCGDM